MIFMKEYRCEKKIVEEKESLFELPTEHGNTIEKERK